MTDRKRTKTEERSLALMLDSLQEQEIGMLLLRKTRSLVPSGWNTMDSRAPITPKKVKVTLSLDADVVEWFRNLGRGYQPRMNAILSAYMHGVISKEIETVGDRDWRDTLL